MSVLAGLIGSGAGIVVIALAVLIGKHYQHLPRMTHDWVARGVIVLMYAGGSAIAVTQVGSWADTAVTFAAGWLGGLNAGIPRTALIVTAMFLIASMAVSVIFAPSPATGALAAAMPLILSLVAGGVLHQFYVATTGPAQVLAASLNAWLGG